MPTVDFLLTTLVDIGEMKGDESVLDSATGLAVARLDSDALEVHRCERGPLVPCHEPHAGGYLRRGGARGRRPGSRGWAVMNRQWDLLLKATGLSNAGRAAGPAEVTS